MTSIGVVEILLGQLRVLCPSDWLVPPMPPLKKNSFAKGAPSSVTPDWLMHHRGDPAPAIILSGTTLANAPNISDGTKWPISAREPPEAGNFGFRMQPSGATALIGRIDPSLLGRFGAAAHFTA